MAAFLALVAAFAFGAADQYLGSLSAVPWAADVSLLSAPWLVLAFLAGCTQRDPRRGAALGFACTAAALFGYGLMTLSPVENAQLTMTTATGFMTSESPVLIGGIFTGPLYGWLGSRWRTDRTWPAAVAAAGALCLEPLARKYAGRAIRFRTVWMAEVTLGLAMLAYAAAASRSAYARARRNGWRWP